MKSSQPKELAKNVAATVKWYNDNKGYGVATTNTDKIDVWFHFSAIEGVGYKTAVEGESVEIDIIEHFKYGHPYPQASRIKRLVKE